MGKHSWFFAVMLTVFSLASFAQERPASSVVNVFEEAAFQRAAAGLSPDGRNLLAAELDMLLRQYKEAVPLLKALAEKHDKAELWNILAVAYNRAGLWKEAYDACGVSIKLKPDAPFCQGERGVAEYQLGRIGEAEKDLANYLRTEDADGAAHYYRGLALARMGRLTEARASFGLARMHAPMLTAFADYNIALIDAGHGKYKEALEPLKEIDAVFRNDDNLFTRDLRKKIELIRKAETAAEESSVVKRAVFEADVQHAALPEASISRP